MSFWGSYCFRCMCLFTVKSYKFMLVSLCLIVYTAIIVRVYWRGAIYIYKLTITITITLLGAINEFEFEFEFEYLWDPSP